MDTQEETVPPLLTTVRVHLAKTMATVQTKLATIHVYVHLAILEEIVKQTLMNANQILAMEEL